MDQDTDKLIKEQLAKLPPTLQKALNAVPWKSVINQIAGLHNLKPEQKEIIERETMFILYGFESPNDYVDNMVREVAIDENLALDIATEVNEKIFKIISEKVEELEKTPPAPAVTPVNLPVLEPNFAKETLATKPGESPKEVPHVEQKIQETRKQETNNIQIPKEPVTPPITTTRSTYPGGVDPYREPIG